MIVEYSHNNSGGQDWLTKEQWKALEDNGWKTDHCHSATKEFKYLEWGIREWEDITGEYPNEEGCQCCGPPHNFYEAYE